MIAYICTQTLAGLTYLHSIGKVGTLWHEHHMQHAPSTHASAQGHPDSRVMSRGTCFQVNAVFLAQPVSASAPRKC